MKETVLICPVTAEVHQFVKELPKADEEIEFEHIITAASGSGLDIALQMQKTGFPYTLLAHCGTGSYGEMLKETLKNSGITLYNRSGKENGCLYRMIAEDGREAVLCMPGAEYEFTRASLDPLKGKDTACMIVSGDIWFADCGDELAEALLDSERRDIFYIHGDRCLPPDALLWEVLCSLHPVMILKEEEVTLFSGQDELSSAMKEIAALTDNDVIVLREDGVLLLHDGESMMRETDRQVLPDDFVTAYSSCIISGCDVRNSLAAACTYASSKTEDRADRFRKDLKNILIHI